MRSTIICWPPPDAGSEAVGGSLRGAAARGAVAWCIFDNTAAGAALGNALALANDDHVLDDRRSGGD